MKKLLFSSVGPGARASAWLFTALLVLHVPFSDAVELVRDEEVIFDLLNNGTLVLTDGVAKVMSAETSMLRIRRVGLAKDQRLIRAAFRDRSARMVDRGGSGQRYNDAYYHEVAAYVIARHLGLNMIPPTVLRSIPIAATGLRSSDTPREGTLQYWVENTVVEYDLSRGKLSYPGNPDHRNQQLREIRVFDCIIGNLDRHAGNLLIDLNERFPGPAAKDRAAAPFLGKIWAIDHSKAFHGSTRISDGHCRLENRSYQAVSLVFMQGMRDWQVNAVERALRMSGLSDEQLSRLRLSALDVRLHKIRRHLEDARQQSGLNDADFFSSGVWHSVW